MQEIKVREWEGGGGGGGGGGADIAPAGSSTVRKYTARTPRCTTVHYGLYLSRLKAHLVALELLDSVITSSSRRPYVVAYDIQLACASASYRMLASSESADARVSIAVAFAW